jgi:type II secretory pathway pseudopilin PulG
MDDSFAYRTTLPPGPRVEPWMIKTAVVSILLVLAVGLFARWVVTSERESFARGYHPVMPSVKVGQFEGTADVSGTDDEAREATRIALAAARAAAAEGGSFLAADHVMLSTLQPGYTFVDGPSTMPAIVSVAGDRRAWAAAVLGPSGTCFWIRADLAGTVSTGTTSRTTFSCTGRSVLGGDDLAPPSPDSAGR